MARPLIKMCILFTIVFATWTSAAVGSSIEDITSEDGNPVFLTGEDESEALNRIEFASGDEAGVECEGHYHGEAVGGGPIESGATKAVLTPTYTGCAFAGSLPTVVTSNGCNYILQLEGGNLSTDLTCPEGKSLSMHIYLTHEAQTSEESFCTIAAQPQEGLEGADLEEAEAGELNLSGAVEGVHLSKTGACSSQTSETGKIHLGVAIQLVPTFNNFTSHNGEPFTLTGKDEPEALNRIEFASGDEGGVECEGHYTGEAVGGGLIESGATEATLTPAYSTCAYAGVLPAVVTMNECDYVLAPVGGEATLDLACPEGKSVSIHLYVNHAAQTSEESFCTITAQSQEGLEGAQIDEEEDGKLSLSGTATGVHMAKTGICSSQTSETGKLHIGAVFEVRQGEFTAEEPFILTGSDHVEGLTLFFEEKDIEEDVGVHCSSTHYTGLAFSELFLMPGANTVIVTPEYDSCTFAGAFPVEITMNDCDFELHLGGTASSEQYESGTELRCPDEAATEVHIFLSHEAYTNEQAFCTVTIAEQGQLSGATLTSEKGGQLTLGGQIEGIIETKEGPCGSEESETGALELGATFEGLNEEGKEVPVSISHE